MLSTEDKIFKKKYLKYKNKYLSLKSQTSSAKTSEQDDIKKAFKEFRILMNNKDTKLSINILGEKETSTQGVEETSTYEYKKKMNNCRNFYKYIKDTYVGVIFHKLKYNEDLNNLYESILGIDFTTARSENFIKINENNYIMLTEKGREKFLEELNKFNKEKLDFIIKIKFDSYGYQNYSFREIIHAFNLNLKHNYSSKSGFPSVEIDGTNYIFIEFVETAQYYAFVGLIYAHKYFAIKKPKYLKFTLSNELSTNNDVKLSIVGILFYMYKVEDLKSYIKDYLESILDEEIKEGFETDSKYLKVISEETYSGSEDFVHLTKEGREKFLEVYQHLYPNELEQIIQAKDETSYTLKQIIEKYEENIVNETSNNFLNKTT